MSTRNIFTPGRIGKLVLKNRIMMAPIGSRLTNENGAVTEDMIKFYALRAEGGAGSIIIEAMGVMYPEGVGKPNHVRFHDDSYMPGHFQLTERIHEYGAKVFAMLWHTGINRVMFEGVRPVGPSAIINENTGIIPHELSIEEIGVIVQKFGEAAKRAKLCGYDGLDIHGGHGYLISSFVSGATNKRKDAYGGSFENRIRFPLEVIASVKEHAGTDYPIIIRINGDDFVEGGISNEEAIKFAIALEKAGVDAIDVSAGVYGSIDTMIEPMQYEEGWKLYLAENIKKHLTIPVIGVGVLRTPEKIEEALQKERIDFAALGRELVCEPFWVEKVKNNDSHMLYCISCNDCFERIGKNIPLRCSINPRAAREHHQEVAVNPNNKKRIAVIGAGPAGIHAAIVANRRGHDVVLYEKQKKIGGQLLLAAQPPGKDKVSQYIGYLTEELRRSTIETKMGKSFSVEEAQKEKFDELIVASGASCRCLALDGATEDMVISAWEALRYTPDQLYGKEVVVIGAGSVGCETALYCKEKGASSVSIVEIQSIIGKDIDFITRKKILRELKEMEITVYPSTTVIRVVQENKTLVVQDLTKDIKIEMPCNLLVEAVGASPEDALTLALLEQGFVVHPVGDCYSIGKIGDAVRAGYNIAMHI